MSKKDILSLFALPMIFFLAHGESMAYYLPQPTGPFNIGKTIHYLTDTSRKEELSRDNGNREVTCFMYYPTDQSSLGETIGETLELSPAFFADSPHIFETLDQVRAYAQLNAPLVETNEKFPVIFFSHGLGDPVVFYTSLLEDLASHGYVVIAVQHTYGCEPAVLEHNKIVHMPPELAQFNKEIAGTIEYVLDREQDTWVNDILFVMNALKDIKTTDSYSFLRNKLDFQNAGIFGHSFGGSAAVAVSKLNDNITAIANLDGALWGSGWDTKITKPTMFLAAGKQFSKEIIAQAGLSEDQWQRMMSRDPAPIYDAMECDAFYITVKDADHMTFNDLYYIKSLGQESNHMRAQQIALIRSFLLDFFDIYLTDKGPTLLHQPLCELSEYELTRKTGRL
jgi:dienelactone hydrolase